MNESDPTAAPLGAAGFPVGTWLSLVEHSLGVRGVGSSNLPVPTIILRLAILHFGAQMSALIALRRLVRIGGLRPAPLALLRLVAAHFLGLAQIGCQHKTRVVAFMAGAATHGELEKKQSNQVIDLYSRSSKFRRSTISANHGPSSSKVNAIAGYIVNWRRRSQGSSGLRWHIFNTQN